jgi:molybdopterin-synthase adenylyltransferase
MTLLNREDLERYARHIVLRHVGGPGQLKLRTSSVLVIGAGGLGSPAIQYLVAAGVGRIGIVDDDRVSLSNLQRQTIHRTDMVGTQKVDSALQFGTALNPTVVIEPHGLRIGLDNAAELIKRYDVVVDGSDNFDTRFCVSDTCFRERKPLITAAVNSFDASLTTLRPFERNAQGGWYPTYRCLFPSPPDPATIATCSEAGVIGALTGIVGAMQALEAIREIVGFGVSLVGKLLLIDALSLRFETIHYAWDPENPLNGSHATPQPEQHGGTFRTD